MNIIKKIRQEHHMNQTEFAKILNVHQTAVSQWENGRTNPDVAVARAISKKFNISLDVILGASNGNTSPFAYQEKDSIKIPIFGYIPAGVPMEAIEDILDYEEAPESWAVGGKEFFGLKIKGDSMEPEYRDGDVIIFLRQNDCENNEDCAVAINGNDWTFKRIEKLSNGVLVKPLNPNYETRFFSEQECIDLPVEVKGVFWELRRSRKK